MKKIVKLVYVLPVVLWVSLVDTVNAHVVAEQTVHANVFKAAFAARVSELPLPVGAQTFVRAAGADAELEHGSERTVGLLQVSRDSPGRFVGGGAGQINGGKERREAEGKANKFPFHSNSFYSKNQLTAAGGLISSLLRLEFS